MEDSQLGKWSYHIHRILKKSGKAFFWEPHLYNGQSLLTRFVISLDRGAMARTEEDYLLHFKSLFHAETSSYKNLLRIPYDHIAISLIKK